MEARSRERRRRRPAADHAVARRPRVGARSRGGGRCGCSSPGPAAGVVGARDVGRWPAHEDLITVDIGGTSADIALIANGRPVIRPEGHARRLPHPRADGGRQLHRRGRRQHRLDRRRRRPARRTAIGRRRARARPATAAAAQRPTVTDASIVLGYLDPAYFAGGTLSLDPALAHRAIEEHIAKPLGIGVREAALGIHRVVNVQMAEGMRLVSISRGVDPRGFALMPFGGGGGLHATALATRARHRRRIVVPRHPGVLCAAGLLAGRDRARGRRPPSSGASRSRTSRDVVAVCARLAADCAELMRSEGVRAAGRRHALLRRRVLRRPVLSHGSRARPRCACRADRDDLRALSRARTTRSTATAPTRPAQFVNLRAVQRVGARACADGMRVRAASVARADKGTRKICSPDRPTPWPRASSRRDGMAAGSVVAGPAIVEQSDTTTLVEPGWQAAVAPNGILSSTLNARDCRCSARGDARRPRAHAASTPITLEVVRNKLEGIANEMQATLLLLGVLADRQGGDGLLGGAVHGRRPDDRAGHRHPDPPRDA